MAKPVLYILSGLPGSGKTTIAEGVSRALNCVYLRIDTIEQGLRELCDFDVEGEGYRLAYRVARDNLQAGMSVIADSCNPIPLTRREWGEVALSTDSKYLNIEVLCSDTEEHRDRVENRDATVSGLKLPTWEDVQNREYHAWKSDRLTVDTAGRTIQESIDETLLKIEAWLCR
ncbi:MAG TPA: AAA family ATPase [Pseudomonadales bacterium]|jgi:predicted kinase|nr:AAA family ATPase [Pseudomonadales bacterium]